MCVVWNRPKRVRETEGDKWSGRERVNRYRFCLRQWECEHWDPWQRFSGKEQQVYGCLHVLDRRFQQTIIKLPWTYTYRYLCKICSTNQSATFALPPDRPTLYFRGEMGISKPGIAHRWPKAELYHALHYIYWPSCYDKECNDIEILADRFFIIFWLITNKWLIVIIPYNFV